LAEKYDGGIRYQQIQIEHYSAVSHVGSPEFASGTGTDLSSFGETGCKFLVVAIGDVRQTYPEQLQDAFPNVSFGQRSNIHLRDRPYGYSEIDVALATQVGF
jgi:hypothetical protein